MSSVVYKTSNSDPHATNCRLMSENSFDSIKISFLAKASLQNSKSDLFAIHIMRKSKKLLVIDVFKLFRAILKITFLSKKIRGQVCDGDVDVVDKCDEGDGDGRMMR